VNRQSKPSSTRADHFIKDQKEKACQISLESLFEGILEKKKIKVAMCFVNHSGFD
jgi:hypothetical protein